jgi:hypothetical protein
MIRRNFFLKKKWVLFTAFITTYLVFISSGLFMWLILFSGCGWLWLHRRRNIIWRETLKSNGEMFLAPTDGRVVKIGKWTDPEAGFDYSEIRLQIGLTNNWGLYLPTSSEMEFLKSYDGVGMAKEQFKLITSDESAPFAKTDMVLRSKNGIATRLRFMLSDKSHSPKIWMKSGDRGRGAACFGYYPFGGSLIIYIPQPSDVLVVENESVTAGQTVLAVFKTQG